MTDTEVYAGAAILGAASGMRSFAGPALVTQVSHSGVLPVVDNRMNFLKHPASAQGSFVAALAELVFDKLPNTPSRLATGPLIARALSGGFSGAVLTSSKKRSVFVGAVIGSLAAVATATAGYHLRRLVSTKLRIPDPLVALAEDATVIACASAVLGRLHEANRAQITN